MDISSIKSEPEVNRAASDSKDLSQNKPVNNKRKSETAEENANSSETSVNNISPESATSSSNLASGREKRIRKIKAYDDDFLMYDVPSCSNSSLIQNLAKQVTPAQENTHEIKYSLGDLVWAKVSGHPWWPCMISNPDLSPSCSTAEAKNSNEHFKLIGGSRPKRSFYVQFFGPSVEHAWVPEGNIIFYKGLQSFKAYAQQQIDKAVSKSAKDKMNEKYSLKISMPKREEWDQAIAEADSLMRKRPRDRKSYFLKQSTGKDNQIENSSTDKANKLKRNSLDEEHVQSEAKKSCLNEEVNSETSQDRQDYFIESTSTKADNPLKLVIKKKPIEDSENGFGEQFSPESDQTSTKTDELDDKVILNMASKFDEETFESSNADSYLTDRYKNAAYHIKQGLSIDEVCNKYRISKSALIKYLERGTAPRGKKTRLTELEEKELVDWLINYKELRYCDAINIVFDKVIDMFKNSLRKNPFPNGKPSVDWWYDFLSRHPQIMASKPDWIKRGKINDKYIQDVQSGNLKCTKFRRALLSAILYIRKMNEAEANQTDSLDEESQESHKQNGVCEDKVASIEASQDSEAKVNEKSECLESVEYDYDLVEYSLNSGIPDEDINKLLDSLASDESELTDGSNDQKYEMKYLFVNNDDEDDYEYDLNENSIKSSV
uniref:Histone-lysine N-methyltransferase NSD2 isoform X1 n=1 Tax=Brachionus koreanus TaxID=1199090 RepID=A0A4Y6ESA1_9BILA|nr:histone-lysine N-methyltransferase NSD2 isoform X1 [Brachionus koreanus]